MWKHWPKKNGASCCQLRPRTSQTATCHVGITLAQMTSDGPHHKFGKIFKMEAMTMTITKKTGFHIPNVGQTWQTGTSPSFYGGWHHAAFESSLSRTILLAILEDTTEGIPESLAVAGIASHKSPQHSPGSAGQLSAILPEAGSHLGVSWGIQPFSDTHCIPMNSSVFNGVKDPLEFSSFPFESHFFEVPSMLYAI